jgi:hypothetical protein
MHGYEEKLRYASGTLVGGICHTIKVQQQDDMKNSVDLVRTDVSEERTASIIRVTRIGELGTLPVTRNFAA